MLQQVYINWAAHFVVFTTLLFFMTLTLRELFVYQDSYLLAKRLLFVLIVFGGELAMTYFPDYFMITWQNIIFNIVGGLLGSFSAEAWAVYRREKLKRINLPNSIFERYKNGASPEEIAEAVSE